jgi:4-hydroxy-3-polyprenylbenzoate decarboxylase
MRLIVGVSGSSGIIYGIRLLEVLSKRNDIEVYLTITRAAELILREELSRLKENVVNLAEHNFEPDEMDAPIASGSFPIDGMVVVPCSMKTLAGISSGYSENLLLRAADVTIKENRPLIIVPRETPLSPIHLENMLKLSRLGVTVLPAIPAFYHNPSSVEEIVDYVVGKILDVLNIEHSLFERWKSR